MLNTLIESRGHRRRNTSGTVVAITAHALLIGGAAYATAAAAVEPDSSPIEVLHVIAPRDAVKEAPRRTSSKPAAVARSTTASVPAISVNVSPNLPPVDIPLADPSAGNASDFPVNASAGTGTVTTNAGPAAYESFEVESEVAVESGLRPEYPAALRAAGVEGRVIAQFTVTVDGRTDPASIHILSSTNELFSESVRKALLKSRFRAARIGSKNVAQRVQQLFVFKLDR